LVEQTLVIARAIWLGLLNYSIFRHFLKMFVQNNLFYQLKTTEMVMHRTKPSVCHTRVGGYQENNNVRSTPNIQ
jgi:hypothetical protein